MLLLLPPSHTVRDSVLSEAFLAGHRPPHLQAAPWAAPARTHALCLLGTYWAKLSRKRWESLGWPGQLLAETDFQAG